MREHILLNVTTPALETLRALGVHRDSGRLDHCGHTHPRQLGRRPRTHAQPWQEARARRRERGGESEEARIGRPCSVRPDWAALATIWEVADEMWAGVAPLIATAEPPKPTAHRRVHAHHRHCRPLPAGHRLRVPFSAA
jgi:hypothetical protein